MAAETWLLQDNYHKEKPGKSRMDYEGFRALALCSVEGRILEELWAQRHAVALKGATPSTQESEGECLAASLLDFERYSLCASR
eukprot:2618732-Pyramimonas_sp.AAC.1